MLGNGVGRQLKVELGIVKDVAAAKVPIYLTPLHFHKPEAQCPICACQRRTCLKGSAMDLFYRKALHEREMIGMFTGIDTVDRGSSDAEIACRHAHASSFKMECGARSDCQCRKLDTMPPVSSHYHHTTPQREKSSFFHYETLLP
jgi:hypothetical protein